MLDSFASSSYFFFFTYFDINRLFSSFYVSIYNNRKCKLGKNVNSGIAGVEYRYNKATFDKYDQQSGIVVNIIFGPYINCVMVNRTQSDGLYPPFTYEKANIDLIFDQLTNFAYNGLQNIFQEDAYRCLWDIIYENENDFISKSKNMFYSEFQHKECVEIANDDEYRKVVSILFSISLNFSLTAEMKKKVIENWVVPVYNRIFKSVDNIVNSKRDISNKSTSSEQLTSGSNKSGVEYATVEETKIPTDFVCYIVIDTLDFDEIFIDMEKIDKAYEDKIFLRLNLSSVYSQNINCYMSPYNYENKPFDVEIAKEHITKISSDYLQNIINFLIGLKEKLEPAGKYASLHTRIGKNIKVDRFTEHEMEALLCVVAATPVIQGENVDEIKENILETLKR